MFGAIPGKNPVVPWIKDLIGNLLPFPVVLLVLVIFYQFSSLSGAGNEGGFVPPFLIGRGQSGAIASLMGLALILALPEIVKDSKKGLVKEGFGTMIFKAATESAKQGWKGGELIPGTGIKTPGARQAIETPLFGTKKSRDSFKEGDTFWKKGALGGTYERGAQYWRNRQRRKGTEDPVKPSGARGEGSISTGPSTGTGQSGSRGGQRL